MKLDVGVLFLLGIPLALVCGVLHYALWRRKREPALLWWAWSDWIGLAAVPLILAVQVRPAWIALRPLGDTILFASGLMLWLGFRRFAGQSLPLRTFSAGVVAYFIAFEALFLYFPDLAALIVLASFGHGILHAGVAFDLSRAQLPEGARVQPFLVAVFALHALFYLFRSATAVTVEAGAEFIHTGGLQNATIIFGLVNVLIWNVGALRMAARRAALPAPMGIPMVAAERTR